MFSNKGLFKHIVCPMGAACKVPTCIFSHDFFGSDSQNAPEAASSSAGPSVPTSNRGNELKRQKLADGGKIATDGTGPAAETKAFVGSLVPKRTEKKGEVKREPPKAPDASTKTLKTAQRPVSPPSKTSLLKNKATGATVNKATSATKPNNENKVSLNPRLIATAPAPWGMRTKLLEALHEHMSRLNKQVLDSKDSKLHLDDNELVIAALDEEEKLAKTHGSVYTNMIKHRIVAYKKMKVDDWKAYVKALKDEQSGVPPPPKEAPPPPPVETGLTPEQEMMILSRLIAPQEGLDKYGYVTSVPTEAEIEQAKAGNAASDGWERCERCGTRFQVFPDRREDGALTSGKQCIHHWGKLLRPAYKKTEAITGRAEPSYTCCHELAGNEGCTVKDTHVFKISEAKRLATVLPFISTPPNPKARKDRAVSFDCEMGYTVYGLELIRLTATSWPDGAPLIDVLVRPLGAILDLNTRFSGVSPELFFNALEYDPKDSLSSSKAGADGTEKPTLCIVGSPVKARDLLLSYISPETPLIGHGIENDLNTVRLVHPAIVDTTALYPHPKGLPFRLSLKSLTKQMLSREIQTAGAEGHDSLEDARATGDLVRVKVGKEWRKLRHEGWTVTEEGFCPPMPPGSGGVPKPADLPALGVAVLGKSAKKKRKRAQTDGATDDEAEDTPEA